MFVLMNLVVLLAAVTTGGLALPTTHATASSKKSGNSTVASEFPKYSMARICMDLCMAGLSGVPCGSICDTREILAQAQTFKQVIAARSSDATTKLIRGPRQNVCPLLCAYGLGDPLCGCDAYTIDPNFMDSQINWMNICVMFCDVEGLSLYGCPKCGDKRVHKHGKNIQKYLEPASKNSSALVVADMLAPQLHRPTDVEPEEDSEADALSTNVLDLGPDASDLVKLNEEVDWAAWCHVLCQQGDGGIACNCDLNP